MWRSCRQCPHGTRRHVRQQNGNPTLGISRCDHVNTQRHIGSTFVSTPPFLRRRLGRRLKALRESAGLNLDEAANRLDKARSSLHRIETGETRADVHLIRSMMDLYDRYEEDLLEQAREALKPLWFRAYD